MHSTNIAQYPSIGIVSQGRFFVNSNIFQMRPLSIELLIGGGQSWWTGEQAIPPLPHPQFAMVAPLRSQARLRLSLAYWAYYGLLPPLAAAFVRPYQFPLKSCGFSGAETARKRFLLWKMGFSDTAYCEPLHPSIQHGRPLRSQARLRHSLLHWAYFALFRPQGARFVRPRRTRRRGRLKCERASAFSCAPSGFFDSRSI